MAIERTWEQQGPVAFTADGEENGVITITSVCSFKVKQRVVLSSNTQPDLVLEIKRVLSYTQLIVGPIKDKTHPAKSIHNLQSREDITAFTVADAATIKAPEQGKTRIPDQDIIQAVYEREPTLAIRTMPVDCIGNPYTKNNRFPVDGSFSAELDIEYPDKEGLTILDIAAPATEVSFTFPNKTQYYIVKARDEKDVIKVGLNAGDITNGDYWTIPWGNADSPEQPNDFPNGYTLYFESKHKNNVELEIRYWYFS